MLAGIKGNLAYPIFAEPAKTIHFVINGRPSCRAFDKPKTKGEKGSDESYKYAVYGGHSDAGSTDPN